MASSLTIENVHAAYGAVRVIEDVSISVGAGETVALLGTNGNGKSTLMKCVMGLVRPWRGSVSLDLDGTVHDDVAAIGDADGLCKVLLGHQDGELVMLLELLDGVDGTGD